MCICQLHRFFNLIVIVGFCFSTSSTESVQENANALIVNHVMENYDKRLMPETDGAKVDVTIRMNLRGIKELDVVDGKLRITAFMSQQWYDRRLAWMNTQYNTTHRITLSKDRVWRPHLQLVENVCNPYKETYADMVGVVVKSDGLVTYSFPAVFETSCTGDIYYFPFDEHACELTFRPRYSMEEEINLMLTYGTGVDPVYFLRNLGWNLVHFGAHASTQQKASSVVFDIVLGRSSVLYLYYLYYPNALINLLATTLFLIPCNPEARKITLGIGIILMLVMYLWLLTSILPLSEKLPIIVAFMAMTFSLVSLSLVLSILIIRIHYTGRHDNRCTMPVWMQHLFLDRLAWILCFNSCLKDEHEEHPVDYTSASHVSLTDDQDRPSYDRIDEEDKVDEAEEYEMAGLSSNASITSSDSTKERRSSLKKQKRHSNEFPSGDILLGARPRFSIPSSPNMFRRRVSMSVRPSEVKNHDEEVYYKILKHMEQYADKRAGKMNDLENRCQWQKFSKLMNRLFVIIYAIITACMWIFVFISRAEPKGE